MAEREENKDVLSLLDEAQKKQGQLSAQSMLEIAQECQVPVGDLYGLATFYGFLSARPLGRGE